MPRLFGAVKYRNENGLDDIAEILGSNLSVASGGEGIETAGEDGVILGLVKDQQPFDGGITSFDKERCIVAYSGFIPSTETVCSKYGIPRDSGTAGMIMALYRKIGDDFFREVPGMSSIALYDMERKRLLIAGDRSGAFPLYYYRGAGSFVFASSLNAVREGCSKSRLRTASVVEHLLFDALYGRYTFYEDIYLTEFGTFLSVDLEGGAVKRAKYFSYEELFDIDHYRSNRAINAPEELTFHVGNCLQRIMENQDISAFGLSCGGGIDCSYLGGVLNDIGFPLPILCTSVSDARLQEDGMARDTAERLGTELHTSYLLTEDFYPFLLRSIIEFDQPIVHPATPKFYAGSGSEDKDSRPRHIMGVASDLLFGGYGNVISFYKYLKIRSLFHWMPGRMRTLLRVGSVDLEKIKLQLRMRNSLIDMDALGMGNLERGADQAAIREALSEIENRDEREVKALMIQNLFDYQQHLLNRRYEISARCGISLYYPFLDLEMLKFAVNLPVSQCVNWKDSKVVVRKAALPYLGEGLAARAKYGGDVPIDKWIKPMRGLLRDGFVAEALGYDPERLDKAVGANMKVLWNMIDLELWGRLCIRGDNPESILDMLRDKGVNCSSYNKNL